jgi:hypothetical protein
MAIFIEYPDLVSDDECLIDDKREAFTMLSSDLIIEIVDFCSKKSPGLIDIAIIPLSATISFLS